MATPKLRFKEFDGDWQIDTISSVFTNKSKSFKPQEETNLPCIELEHLSQGTGTILGTVDSKEQQSTKNLFEPNSVLYGKLRPYLRKFAQPQFKGVCSSEIWVLNGIKIENNYLYQYIQSEHFTELTNIQSGSKMPRADWRVVSSSDINYPSLKEQTKIATFLSAVDTKIDELTQKHELLTDYKKGMMQQLFSQKLRFKADDGSDFEDWEDTTFEKAKIHVIDGDRGNNYPKSENFYEQGFCLFLNAGNVTKDGFKFEEMQFIDEKRDSLLRKGKLEREDIIITTRGTVGNIAYFDNSIIYNNIRINSGMVIIRSKAAAIPMYLTQFLTSSIFKEWVNKNVFGSAQPQLTVKLLKSIPIPLPEKKEQTKIANFLTAIDQKIDNVAEQIDHAKTWKKGLLQQMFV